MPEKPTLTGDGSHPPKSVILFTVVVTLLATFVFVGLLFILLNEDLLPADSPMKHIKAAFVLTTCTMFIAGVIGGCLYSFRGITIHASRSDYSRVYDLTYYLKPLSSGICGLLVFFLLLGGAMSLNIGVGETSAAWQTFSGRMPYIVFSLLAGYGSHEFMLKLKDLSESIFAVKDK